MALARGPYIQSTSRRDTKIVWYTNNAGQDSIVKLGTSQTNLNMTFTDTTIINTVQVAGNGQSDTGFYKHIVRVTGLLPDTKYFYSIGSTQSGTILAASANNFFWTNFDKNDSTKKKRIWVVADIGDGSGGDQANARDAFINYNNSNPIETGNPKVAGWIWIGDIAYSTGLFSEFQSYIFSLTDSTRYSAPLRNNTVYTALGNHDYGTSTSNVSGFKKEYFTIFSLPQNSELGGIASLSQKYYSYDIGNVHIIALDGYLPSAINSGSPQYNWLRRDLQNVASEISLGKKKWILIYEHFPPFADDAGHSTVNNGSTEGTNFRNNILPILDTYNIDVALYGHSHCYERSRFIYGFYGQGSAFSATTYSSQPSSTGSLADPYRKDLYSGCVHTIQGNAGASLVGINGSYNNLNCSTGSFNGSGMIDILPGAGTGGIDRLHYRMLNTTGVFDEFYMDK